MAEPMSTAPTPAPAKIHALHGLRGLMAWWVVLGHVSLTFGWTIPIINKNTLAVDVFILLSGFVIAMLIDRKQERYDQYLIRRAFRLFPLYLVVLAVSALLLPIQRAAWGFSDQEAVNIFRVVLAEHALDDLVAQIAVHIPLLQGLIPTRVDPYAAYTIVGQAWSISLEWQFYLLAPLLAPRKWNISLVVIAFMLSAALIFASRFFAGAFLGAKIIHFLIGICTYYLLNKDHKRRWFAITTCLAAVALYRDGLWQLVPLGLWAAVIWSCTQPVHSAGHGIARCLGTRTLYQMGEISYSVYLIHMIPLYTSLYLLGAAGLASKSLHIAVLGITVAATLILAFLSYRWIEKPGIDAGAALARHLTRTRPVSQAT